MFRQMTKEKESWLTKLIELLNEYGKEKWNPFYEWGFNSNEELFCKWLSSWYSEILIISKKFWFIKWLVENDKIDIEKVEKKFYNEICITDYWDKDRAYWKSDLVISVLSISDTPIDFLCKIIKN